MPTEDMEFFDPLEASGVEWTPVEGYPDGTYERVLYEDDNGTLSRFLLFEAGVETESVITHDYYEEVYIIEGGLIDKRLGEPFSAGMYTCRTPGMEHGPYYVPIDCLSFEHRYYE